MTPDVSTSLNVRQEPDRFARVPGFPGIEAGYCRHEQDPAEMEYCGTAEDLIAAGIATAAMLETNRRTGPRRKRIDADGDAFRLLRYWRTTKGGQDCAPYRYFRLTRRKPHSRIGGLPGAREAIAAYEKWSKWVAEWRAAQNREAAEAARRPTLRLVVDNTRVVP